MKFKMQISTQADSQKQRKNATTNENCSLRKMGLNFKILASTLCKIAFWNRQKKSRKFSFQLDRKNKIWFFTFLNVYFSRTKQDKILISQLTTPNKVSQQFGREKQIKKMTY